MSYIDELQELVGEDKVVVTIASTSNVEVSYVGKITVHEDTDRFTVKPKTVITTVDGWLYESYYDRELGVSFDIDDIASVNMNSSNIVLKQ